MALPLLLSGCFYQKADTSDLLEATTFCGSLEKVLYIRVDSLGDEEVYCVDSRNKFLHRE